MDTPISEAGFTGAAAGAAHMGLRPVVEMQFMDFVSCAYEPLTNYIATSRWRKAGSLAMVIRGPVGGGVRGGPFHSQNPEMAFFHTPGLKIVYPCTARDAKGLLKAAIRDDDPVLYFEHKKLYRAPFLRETLPQDDYVVPLGEARVHREGTDLTIVTYGMMVHESQKAAETLAEEGIEVEILDLRTLMPLDEAAILESVKKTNRLLVVHEDTRTGGIAGEIAMRVNERLVLRALAMEGTCTGEHGVGMEKRDYLPRMAAAREIRTYVIDTSTHSLELRQDATVDTPRIDVLLERLPQGEQPSDDGSKETA